MKIHEYYDIGRTPMPDIAPDRVGYICAHCGDVSVLYDRQIRDMPPPMAECLRGREIGLIRTVLAVIYGSVNCLGKGGIMECGVGLPPLKPPPPITSHRSPPT